MRQGGVTGKSGIKFLFGASGIYASFVTWALVQEPLTTRVWPNSGERFRAPGVTALVQAVVAMLVGMGYMRWKRSGYGAVGLLKDYGKELAFISLMQSVSAPLAAFSLQYVDYLTYMLAKSCKMLPVLLVHLVIYRTPIQRGKKLVALVVTLGVTVFTLGGSQSKKLSRTGSSSVTGFGLLILSLFLDGMTNATQDEMLRNNREHQKVARDTTITGAHLMFALNLFMVLYNSFYLLVLDNAQLTQARILLAADPDISRYLITYAICGAVGQCFIFYTLEEYGSLVLVMITVTRKMISMLLSIAVFGKRVGVLQWLGIITVFGGISWEALSKRKTSQKKTQ
ncbi:hypothetical protein HG537_0F01310 [Torulaspora globosa]|uniref:UDP-galactose transporter homolog 1 n=1 Tax=Torulaspora globosa TaxID=48254 RepID=A0A7H9HVH1_9SACH|nr:hypothetical protein HG537_0F01310 [Torulaspora sp. CBS 2947]